MACPCCWAGALCAVAPLAQRLSSTPTGKAALVFLAPFLCVAMALAVGAVEYEQLSNTWSCVYNCACTRSYAIGALALWLLAMQAALRSGAKAPPKSDKAAAAPPPVPELDANGKVAAKAA